MSLADSNSHQIAWRSTTSWNLIKLLVHFYNHFYHQKNFFLMYTELLGKSTQLVNTFSWVTKFKANLAFQETSINRLAREQKQVLLFQAPIMRTTLSESRKTDGCGLFSNSVRQRTAQRPVEALILRGLISAFLCGSLLLLYYRNQPCLFLIQ